MWVKNTGKQEEQWTLSMEQKEEEKEPLKGWNNKLPASRADQFTHVHLCVWTDCQQHLLENS